MSTRSFADGRKLIGNKTSAKGRLDAAVLAGMEPLEQRQMLNAAVLPVSGVNPPSGSAPLPPIPGVTFYINGQSSSNAWQWNSAVTPYTVNDLLLNVQAYAQNYAPCCEGNNSAVGNTSSINSGRLFTNGLTQNQVGNFPATGAVAATGSGSNSDASSGESVLSQNGNTWWLEYNLGAAPGQTPNSNGYDISEIDVIAGHQDGRTGMQADILVQYVGGNSTDWFSLSNNQNFNYTGLGRGSAQMAIQSPGGPMAQNVRAVKFFAANDGTWYRELVVTGTGSQTVPTVQNAPGTPVAQADPVPGAIDVVFTLPQGGAQSYSIQRATVTGGVLGSFTTIAGTVTNINPTTYVDTTAAANTTYVYRIVAQSSSPNGVFTATSGNSVNFTTPPVGAEAHYYNMAYWEGPVTVAQGVSVVQLNWPSGSMAPGIRGSADSSVITGKVTPTESGTYTFYSNTDDDGYLYVNGVLVSSDPGGHGQRNASQTLDINEQPLGFALPVSLTAGTGYNFVLLEHNGGGGAGANLIWKNADGITETVPSGVLSPVSDAPTAPTNLTVTSSNNSNFVNFTFTGQNNAVVHYILQRAYSSSPTVWTTVAQIDPGSDSYAANLAVTTSTAHAGMIIADSSPLPGSTYFYRVAAVNYDGVATTPTVAATLTTQTDLVSPPTAAVTLGTAVDAAGMAAGTYFVQYAWVNATTGITTASTETSIVTTGVGDVTVALPAAPAGAVNGNVYLSNASGAERFVGNAAGGGTVTVRGLPITSAAAAPATNTAGLVAGTYFVAYTWVGNGTTVTGESSYAAISNVTRSLLSNETSIVLAGTNDILVNGFTAAPPGVGSVNVYIGTSSGSERFIGSTTPTGSLVIATLPSGVANALPQAQINNTALVSSSVGAQAIPIVTGTNPAGVEIHAYNMELFRRTTLNSVVEASAVAQNGLAAEYIAQITNQTYTGGFYAGPIDRNYSAQTPNPLQAPPSSPDPTLFPDYDRIHTESFSQAFTATLTPAISGIYTIISNTDDDGIVWLDGTIISGDLGGHGQQDTDPPAATYTNQPTRGGDTLIPVFLLAGKTYDLTMFMGNTGGGSGAHLKWVEPPKFGGANTGNVFFGSNADQTGATLSFDDPSNGSITSNYNNYTVFITAGPGAGQAGTITNYNTANKQMTVNVTTNGNASLWSTVPTSASKFQVSWVAAVPLYNADAYPVASALGGNDGLSLHQDLPVMGTWSTSTGSVTLTTSASAAQNVTITQLSPTAGVSLSWSDQGLDELWYEVQRSSDGVNFSTVGTTPMNVGTTFTDTTAGNAFGSPTISYFYRVRGVNFDGAGPFSPIINTKNNILIPAPQIAQAIQGAPGTIGLVFSGGSPIAGGLDVQYATLNAGVTGSFVDATPLGLPFNTFDYQVTGLVPTQQYVFKVRNLVGNNNTNTALYGTPIAFTPVGGVQEAFGTPGSGVGGFVGTGSTIGDLLVNTNSSLTGAGVPAPATPATPTLTTPGDMTDPGFNQITSATSATDAPAPTNAGTFFTTASNLSLSGTASVFLEYTWLTANGETLPFSTPVSFSIPSNTGVLLTYAVPSAPAGYGITNANIYIGTSTAPSAELLLGQAAQNSSTIISTFAAVGSKSAPTLSTTGIPQGTYFVQYAWTNAAGQHTNSSLEQSFIVTNPSNDLFLPLPTPVPANATNFNLYVGTVGAIGTVPGNERLAANVAANTTTLALRGIPISSAATAPTTNNAGLPAGTYFLQYTWNGTLPNETAQTNEGLASPLTSIVITTPGEDVALPVPASPAGTGNANVYFGTSPNVHSPVVPVTLATQTDATGLAAATYFVKYTWKAGTGETGTSAEQSIVAGAGSDVLVTLPAAPQAGVVNGNIYISTNSGGEKLAGTFAAGATATITALPATNAVTPPANTSGMFLLGQAAGGTTFLARTIPTSGNRPPIPGTIANIPANLATIAATADSVITPTAPMTVLGTAADSGSTIVPGTYYLKYTWLGNGGETGVGPESTVVVPAGGNADIGIKLPAAPSGASNGNVYLGTTSNGETLLQQVVANTVTSLKTLPATNAVAAPSASNIGVPAGTYYVAYTWTSGTGLETAGSPEQTIVAPANADITVVPPVNPVGQSSTRVYIGTASGQEFFSNTVASLATLTIRSIPNLNSRIVPTINSQAYRLTTPANTLQVTSNNSSQAGNSFNLGENIAGFTTSFDFVMEGNSSADGFGIVFTPDGRTYTGGSGGSVSYVGTSPSMQRSAAILFDTYNGNGTGRTGIALNGNGVANWIDMKTMNNLPTGVVITNNTAQDQRPGDVFSVTINYNNTTHIITENVVDTTLKNRGVNNGFSTSYSIDLVATIGMPAAYVGFVGGTGGAQGEHDVLNWTFSNSTAIALDTITGTTGVDQITLTQDPDHTHIDWTMNGNPQVYQETITSANGLTINGLGSNDVITLNNANGNPLPNNLKLNGIFTVNGLQGTAPLTGTTVDMKTSTVFIPYGAPASDPISLIQGYLKTGFSGGSWTGTAAGGAINSSSAAATPLVNGIGFADSADLGNPAVLPANTIEIRYTVIGDSNLDGTVGGADYAAVVQNYGTGTMWDQGDVTYEAKTGGADYAAVVQHYGQSATSPAAAPAVTPAAAPVVTPAVSTATTNSSLPAASSSVTLGSSSSSTTADSSSDSANLKKKKASKVKKH